MLGWRTHLLSVVAQRVLDVQEIMCAAQHVGTANPSGPIVGPMLKAEHAFAVLVIAPARFFTRLDPSRHERKLIRIDEAYRILSAARGDDAVDCQPVAVEGPIAKRKPPFAGQRINRAALFRETAKTGELPKFHAKPRGLLGAAGVFGNW